MREAEVKPLPRKEAGRLEPPRSQLPMHERLNFTPNLANRLGARVPEWTETRECNAYHVIGHIAKFCHNQKRDSNGGGNEGGNNATNLGDKRNVSSIGGGNGAGGSGGYKNGGMEEVAAVQARATAAMW